MAQLHFFVTSILMVLGLTVAAPLNDMDRPDSTPFALVSNKDVFRTASADVIPNRYIVVYNNTFESTAIDAKEAFFAASLKKRNIKKRGLDGRELSPDIHSLSMDGWRASILEADDDMFYEMHCSDEVAYIEADTMMKTQAVISQTNATPGLARISHASPGASNYVFDQSGGQGITAYIVDTGIRASHVEYEGRATLAANFVDQVVSVTKLRTGRYTYANLSVSPPTKTATDPTLLAPSAVLPLVSPRTFSSWPSRSSARMAAVPTLVSSRACSSSWTMSPRRALAARPS